MIGREIIFKKIARSGKQIVGITFVQSIGTFLFVTVVFTVVFLITDITLLRSGNPVKSWQAGVHVF